MLRCSGGSVRARDDTSRSPTWISPSEGSRKPAISRSVVVLPQPDGPSRQTSCPWSIFKETLSTTASEPNRLVRPRKSTDANRLTPTLVFARISARLGMPVYGQKRVGKGRGLGNEPTGPVVPANAGTHPPRPSEWAGGETALRQQLTTTADAERLRPRFI